MTALATALATLERDGEEPGGAACVVRGGEVLDEAWTGTRDGVTPWTADTLVMCYSVAKPVAALTVLSVVAEGALALDRPVADLWPEYAARGKAGTTVRHVLAHQAGLPCFPPAAAHTAYDDREALVALLADAEPAHPPGTAVAEHALTYGHLCDELVRRATGEPLADRWRRFAAAHGWDLHLSLTAAELDRVADVVPVVDGWARGYLDDPRWGPALGRPAGLLDPEVLNNRRWRTTSFPAISLHASARGLALLQADLVDPEGAVAGALGPDLHAAVLAPQAEGPDLVLGREVAWTLGYQRDVVGSGFDARVEVGMGGAGGCAAWTSLTDGYGAAYVSRGLGGHDRSEVVDRAVREQWNAS